MDYLTLKHSMPAGDLLSILPGLKHIWEQTGKRWLIYQRVNLEYGDVYGAYPGAAYSIKNEMDVPVTMNTAVFNALKPLLTYQEYIEDFKMWDGQKVDYDMDMLRLQETSMPYGSLNRWPFYIWPEMACDLSKPWLRPHSIQYGNLKDKILVNRTERYNNMLISYRFLKEYGDKVIFVGLPHEHTKFCVANNLDIPILDQKDFLGISIALSSCKLYIGGQSSIFQVAEGLKIPRLLEVCKPIPNVIGSGPGFYDFVNQNALEYYIKKLYYGE